MCIDRFVGHFLTVAMNAEAAGDDVLASNVVEQAVHIMLGTSYASEAPSACPISMNLGAKPPVVSKSGASGCSKVQHEHLTRSSHYFVLREPRGIPMNLIKLTG